MKSPPVVMGVELPDLIHCTVGVPVTPLATLTLHVRVYDCPSVGFLPALTDTITVKEQTCMNSVFLLKGKSKCVKPQDLSEVISYIHM